MVGNSNVRFVPEADITRPRLSRHRLSQTSNARAMRLPWVKNSRKPRSQQQRHANLSKEMDAER